MDRNAVYVVLAIAVAAVLAMVVLGTRGGDGERVTTTPGTSSSGTAGGTSGTGPASPPPATKPPAKP